MPGVVITCWYKMLRIETRISPSELVAVFNHISDGYDEKLKAPKPTSEEQRISWAGAKWEARKAALCNGHVREENVLSDGPMERIKWI